jgi:hypothetical protein
MQATSLHISSLLYYECFSGAPADGAAKPPGAAFGGHEQVYPAPGFLDDPVTGGHGEEKEAGDGGNLLQTPVAQMPLKAVDTAGAVSPHYYSSGCQQDDGSQQAKRAKIGRYIVHIEGCAAHDVFPSGYTRLLYFNKL